MKYYRFFAVLFVLFLISTNVCAQESQCLDLNSDQKRVYEEALTSVYSYDCCDETIGDCLKAEKPCKLATLLAGDVCRMAKNNSSVKAIKRSIELRSLIMGPSASVVEIPMYTENVWGNPKAKVVLSVYLCARCPYCAKHVPALVKRIENSPLKEKVALNLRLFPIKSNENSTPAAIAVESAAMLGKAWPYLIKNYEQFEHFNGENAITWATDLGLDAEKFKQNQADKNIRMRVVESKKEGLTHTVSSTPTFFINGRRIDAVYDEDLIFSMIEEALLNNP